MIGDTLSHYRIIEKLGQGGMGEVYLAHDEHLDRRVAIKVLPPGSLSDDSARKRFRREALALAKLNHPNIATSHDFDSAGGVDFLVMEYVAGPTLGSRLAAGPLPEKQIAQLGEQLAEGLAAAHAAGVVHTDLKPDNLRVTDDGRLKILDFGLARLLKTPGVDVSTMTAASGTVCGTLPYMAPEQLRGDRLDARTDIWAAGAVLYELSTGKRPFEETLGTKLVDDILHSMPPLPSASNRRLSPALEAIIVKCLEKNPENRYQSANELAVDLRRLASPTQLPTVARRRKWPIPAAVAAAAAVIAALFAFDAGHLRSRVWGGGVIDSIAVLPFQNISQDPQQEYFSDGMTEALIAELSRIHALKVISSTSVMRLRNTKKTMPQVAQELDVEGVVEGSVLHAGDKVRVTAQLIRAREDRPLWTESYERDLKDIISLQTELARAIAGEIRITVTAQEERSLARSHTVLPEAHEAYLKGRYYANRTANARAIEAFQQAISKDPQYAEAYASLAQQYAFALPAHEVMPKAKAMALKAVELDDSLAEAHAALATVAYLYEWQWAEAEKELKRALELDPNSTSVHTQYAYFLIALGRLDEALKQAEIAQRLDPLSLSNNLNYGRALYFARRFDEAIAQYNRTLELDGNYAAAHLFLCFALEQKGRLDEAMAHMIKARTLVSDNALAGLIADTYARIGYIGTLKAWAAYWESGIRDGSVQPTSVAMLYARAGDKDKAMQYLEQGFREHTRAIVTLKVEPQLDNLRTDPRFTGLIKRMGLPE